MKWRLRVQSLRCMNAEQINTSLSQFQSLSSMFNSWQKNECSSEGMWVVLPLLLVVVLFR